MDQRWQVEVLAGSNTLRAERLTRDLRDRLAGVADVQVDLIAHEDTTSGHKGGFGDLGMWVALAGPTAPVLITAIKEWCGRDRHRKVELTRDGTSVTATITGDPTEAQERVIQRFLGIPSESTTESEDS
jgi:hypothetical protein